MRLHSHGPDYRAVKLELSMTSMIDVVFLLLIFFLVTSTFVKPEKQLRSALQPAQQSSSQTIADLEPAVVSIVRRGDQVVFRLGAIETSRLEELREPLENFVNKDDGAFVSVGSGVPFEEVARAIGLCRASGFVKVAYVPAD